MAMFSFNGAYITLGPVSGGFAQGDDGNNHFRLSGSGAFGISLNAFSFSIPCECARFQKGDYITVSSTTILFATQMRISYRLCGGPCSGSLTYWTGGLGLGISGILRFTFGE
jgi:hypothetical protein